MAAKKGPSPTHPHSKHEHPTYKRMVGEAVSAGVCVCVCMSADVFVRVRETGLS